MKINKQKQAGLNFNEAVQKKLIQDRCASIDALSIDSIHKMEAKKRVIDTFTSSDSLFYLPTKTVLDLSSRVKIDIHSFDYTFLGRIVDGKKVTFLLGDIFYRWYKTSDKLNVVAVHQKEITDDIKNLYPNGTTDTSYVFFSFDITHGVISFPISVVKPFSIENAHQFIQLLIFTELSPIETKCLNPKQSFGTRRNGKYLNESDRKVIVVDSTWNLNIIITGKFLVSGHFRIQKHGTNFSEQKLIWINSFQKDGYKRFAKKTSNNNNLN